jgi:hypothetical protein
VKREDVTAVLNDPIAQELLQSHRIARLAYDGLDGYPRAIPIGYFWSGHDIVICTPSIAPKVAALRTNPRVALTIDTETQPPHILLVRGTAAMEIVDGIPMEYLEASRKYIAPDAWEDFEVQMRGLYKQMARIVITPDWAKVLDFETRLPVAVEELIAQRV